MSQQHEIEVTKEQLRHQVNMRDSLYKLLSNPDFKALVTEGYIRDEALRLTKLLGDSSIRASEKTYNAVIAELQAIGMLDNHLRMVELLGNQAEASLVQYEQAEAAGHFDHDADE